jgi:hypothetical protein
MDTIRIDSRLKKIQSEWSEKERVLRQYEAQRRLREFLDRFLEADRPAPGDLQCGSLRFEMHSR